MKDPNEKTFSASERRKPSHKEIKIKPILNEQGLSFECSLLGKKKKTRRARREAHLSQKIRENDSRGPYCERLDQRLSERRPSSLEGEECKQLR